MASNHFRQSQLIDFDHAAAGHAGVLSDLSGEFVIKPCKQSEIDFYQSAASHPEFTPYIPTFFGQLTLRSNTHATNAVDALLLEGDATPEIPAKPTNADAPIVENAWTPSNGARIQTDLAIVLENVTANFDRPNVLDVKLGARLWADDAPAEKRAKLEKAAETSTSKPLGFRIAGMRIYQASEEALDRLQNDKQYKLYDKDYGRQLNVHTINQGFEEYFLLARGTKAQGLMRKVINRLITDLKGLAKSISEEESRMFSASLLFVYEGDMQALEAAIGKERDVLKVLKCEHSTIKGDTSHGSGNVNDLTNGDRVSTEPSCEYDQDGLEIDEADEEHRDVRFPAIQTLKLIDFAHAEWTPGHGPDQNVLYGIENVIKILDSLLG